MHDETNNSNNPTPAAAPAPIPAAPPQGQPEQSTVLPDMRDEQIRDLESQLAELREALGNSRLQATIAKAGQKQDSTPSNGTQDLRRQKAIAAVGSLSKWYAQPVEDRVKILCDGDYVRATEEEIARHFGPNASGAEAQALRNRDPRRYRALRALWLETRK